MMIILTTEFIIFNGDDNVSNMTLLFALIYFAYFKIFDTKFNDKFLHELYLLQLIVQNRLFVAT